MGPGALSSTPYPTLPCPALPPPVGPGEVPPAPLSGTTQQLRSLSPTLPPPRPQELEGGVRRPAGPRGGEVVGTDPLVLEVIPNGAPACPVPRAGRLKRRR